MKRVWLGFLACTFAYPIVVLTTGGAAAAGGAIMVGAYTFAASLMGIPLLVWYRQHDWFKLWQFALGGGAIGLVESLVFIHSGSAIGYLAIAAVYCGIGAVHATAFWLLAIFRNDSIQGSNQYPRAS